MEMKELILLIDPPNRFICYQIFLDNETLFKQAQGSTHLHQAWMGGYYDHVCEVMNIAVVQYAGLSRLRPLPFTLPDALLVLFFHDIEKPWKYKLVDGQIQQVEELKDKKAQREYRDRKLKEYGIILTPAQLNGLEYTEGELHNYSNTQRTMNGLAAFCHTCDVISARIWYDYPKRDSWLNAK